MKKHVHKLLPSEIRFREGRTWKCRCGVVCKEVRVWWNRGEYHLYASESR